MKEKDISVSIIIATYNRSSDLIVTLPQLIDSMRPIDELIIVDQTLSHSPEAQVYLDEIKNNPQVSIYQTSPSLTIARNAGLLKATKDVVLYLDDDVDVLCDLCAETAELYKNPKVAAAAGRVKLPGDNFWTPRKNSKTVTALYGCHMSFRRTALLESGGFDIDFKGNFLGEEWEALERILDQGGIVADGEKCIVFHRLQESGGCDNRTLDYKWFRFSYQNHLVWARKRKGLSKFTKFPRHLAAFLKSMMRYGHPSLFKIDKAFINNVIKPAWKESKALAKQSEKRELVPQDFEITKL